MNEVILPLLKYADNEQIEITVQSEKNNEKYRIQPFVWETNANESATEQSLKRISRLKNEIENYDKNWQLIQIYPVLKNKKYIHVLFRQKIQD